MKMNKTIFQILSSEAATILYGDELLFILLLIFWWRAHLMAGAAHIEGFAIPIRRSLTEPILLGGAPRNVAIVNGTIAAALGLGLQLWPIGIGYWLIAHALAVFMTKRDAQFLDVLIRHIRHKGYLQC